MEPDVAADSIVMRSDGSGAVFSFFGDERKVDIALPGAYNIYNALAASTAALRMGIDIPVVTGSLSSFSSGFGRMEHIDIDGVEIKIILVKNPAGLNQVVNHLHSDHIQGILVMILNDKHADGTDISWIWDANFEKIFEMSPLFKKMIFSGTRAEELMLRFKYASRDGIVKNTRVIRDYSSLIDEITVKNTGKHPVYILPTYTAMFEFRKNLAGRYKIRKFWE
jgi:UDP-N-acetylmuramyl tripeptide synthase